MMRTHVYDWIRLTCEDRGWYGRHGRHERCLLILTKVMALAC